MTKKHQCDEKCKCPIHKTDLIYWPKGNEHACQDVKCKYGHGLEKKLDEDIEMYLRKRKKDYQERIEFKIHNGYGL